MSAWVSRVFMESVLMVRVTLNVNVNLAGLDNTVIQRKMSAILTHVTMVVCAKI